MADKFWFDSFLLGQEQPPPTDGEQPPMDGMDERQQPPPSTFNEPTNEPFIEERICVNSPPAVGSTNLQEIIAMVDICSTYGTSQTSGIKGIHSLVSCPQCNDRLKDKLASQEDRLKGIVGELAWQELSSIYYNYSIGNVLYTDLRITKPSGKHSIGLCVGTREDNQGVNCWSQEYDPEQSAYIRKKSYFFQSVVIDKSRAFPDLTEAEELTCDGVDPMLGCWALETPTVLDDGK